MWLFTITVTLYAIQAHMKAEKNRMKAEEVFLKSAHAQRQEASQLRREEKRRAEKEKIMNEEDPDKTRKWEVGTDSLKGLVHRSENAKNERKKAIYIKHISHINVNMIHCR